MTTLKALGGPVASILALEEVKAHLRIPHGEEDGLLAGYIEASAAFIEDFIGRALIERSYRLILDRWPEGPVRFPKPPLIAVDQVAIFGMDGTSTIVAPSDYRVETRAEPGFLLPVGLRHLPQPGLMPSGIEIDFRAGYGRDWNAIPAPIRHAALMMVADLHGSRGSEGGISSRRIEALLLPFRFMGLS
ncbi:MAG: head-tail connector protein [Rhodothalassiaceae bacterium]